jgi:molybdate transport system ATP-binding protein
VKDQVVIKLENVTLRLRDVFLLPNTNWKIDRGQHWALLGPNGAGKTTLVKALIGEVPVVQGKIIFSDTLANKNHPVYVSFEQHQRLVAREELRNFSRSFSRDLNGVTTVYETLVECCARPGSGAYAAEQVAARLQIEHLLERGIQVLSTGEMRKVQIARVLINSPEVLILDEPFDGLDGSSRNDLARIINGLMDDSQTVILVTHRQNEILPNISHVLAISAGKIIFQGKREEVLIPSRMERLYPASLPPLKEIPANEDYQNSVAEAGNRVLVAMQNVTVKYDQLKVLENLNWQVNAGENWVILGPNGCGKTTLLNLIFGDNPQAYANEIYLFGRPRGTGESIWDIKRRTGLISSEFQIRYRKPLTAFEVVLSGFFDSVGLYRNATSEQKETAERWMEVFGIADKSDRPFNHLSYGEQRLLLLARAMVKRPQILLLDEPCQGLDRTNRLRIMDTVDLIGRHSATTIIYVTHYPDEIPGCMTNILQFKKTSTGNYKATSSPI